MGGGFVALFTVGKRKMNSFLKVQKSAKLERNADVAKLADALDLGSSSRKGV